MPTILRDRACNTHTRRKADRDSQLQKTCLWKLGKLCKWKPFFIDSTKLPNARTQDRSAFSLKQKPKSQTSEKLFVRWKNVFGVGDLPIFLQRPDVSLRKYFSNKHYRHFAAAIASLIKQKLDQSFKLTADAFERRIDYDCGGSRKETFSSS